MASNAALPCFNTERTGYVRYQNTADTSMTAVIQNGKKYYDKIDSSNQILFTNLHDRNLDEGLWNYIILERRKFLRVNAFSHPIVHLQEEDTSFSTEVNSIGGVERSSS